MKGNVEIMGRLALINLPRIFGIVSYSQNGREQTISCICKFTDGTEKMIEAASTRQMRMQVVAELTKIYVNDPVSFYRVLYSLSDYTSNTIELDVSFPSFELSKYTASEYMNRCITKQNDTSLGEYTYDATEFDTPSSNKELTKYTISEYMEKYITSRGERSVAKIAEFTCISKQTIYKIWNGQVVEYKRKYLLRIGVALQLPNADLKRFMNAAGLCFPLNPVEHQIEVLHNQGQWNYTVLRSTIGGDLL